MEMFARAILSSAAAHRESIMVNDKRKLDSFPQFSKLPIELRLKIWEMCLPPRLFVSEGLMGYYFGAKTLQIQGACQESRRVVLSRRQMCSKDIDAYRPMHGWWAPSEDLWEWHRPSGPMRTKHVIGKPPPIESVVQNCVVSVTLSSPYCSHYNWPMAKFLDEIVWARGSWSKVKNIFIRPALEQFHNYESSTLHDEFDIDVIHQLLGDDWFTVIDLQDSAEVERVASILDTGELSQDVAVELRAMHEALGEKKLDASSQRSWWDSVKGLAQRDWLRANFAVEEEPSIGYDAKDWEPFQDWDLTNPWIRDTMNKMPQIKPVFVLVKSDMPPRWLWSDEDDEYSDFSDYLGFHPHGGYDSYDGFDDTDMYDEDEDEDEDDDNDIDDVFGHIPLGLVPILPTQGGPATDGDGNTDNEFQDPDDDEDTE